jgi:hypothetical protein
MHLIRYDGKKTENDGLSTIVLVKEFMPSHTGGGAANQFELPLGLYQPAPVGR